MCPFFAGPVLHLRPQDLKYANARPVYRQKRLHSGRRFPPLIIVPEAGSVSLAQTS